MRGARVFEVYKKYKQHRDLVIKCNGCVHFCSCTVETRTFGLLRIGVRNG